MNKFIPWLFLLVSASVWATPSPKEVSDAVRAGHWPQAEQLLLETLKDKPDSAMAHYELGQVFARELRHQDALRELDKAQQLDPTLHFAKSAVIFHSVYVAELSALKQQENKLLGHNTTPAPVHATAPSSSSKSGSTVSFLFAILLFLAVILGAIYWWVNRSDARQSKVQQARRAEQAKVQLAALLQLADALRDAGLECRAAVYAPAQKQLIQAALEGHREQVLQAIASCKNDVPLPDEQLHHLQRETQRFTQAARTGVLPPPPVMDAVAPPVMSSSNGYTAHAGNTSAAAGQPIIINNNTSNDSGGIGSFVTGMVLGEMMSGRHSDEHYRRETSYENSPHNEPQENLPDFDGNTGNSSDDWDSDDSSSFDSGNDDNSWS
jgi:hypothetical protein